MQFTFADTEQMPSSYAVMFPDGHIEAVKAVGGVGYWLNLTSFREAMAREAQGDAA